MAERTLQQQAKRLCKEGYRLQRRDDFEGAVQLYRRSIDLWPTAEAHTFLGWAYSHLERYDDAIAECHRAIHVDPDFGDPYNDIGVYLVASGELDKADTSVFLRKGSLRR